ncbi:alanine racemase [Desulfococcaceae bacterium OttesenSCG-928-F15]|nr:alanine racemase [Desulfococcaceae bacterium OttesenSCG-928-F15]
MQTPENKHLIWAEVDLAAIAHNLQILRQNTAPSANLMAVVKTNAYGHGATEIARTALANGASSLAVARTEEGVLLRNAGIAAPILILGPFLPHHIAEILRYRLTPTIFDPEDAVQLSEYSLAAKRITPIHLKIDTGMGRLGICGKDLENPLPVVSRIADLPGLRIEGIYTHLATADEKDVSQTEEQMTLFQRILGKLKEKKICPPIRHAANSAGILFHPETHLDLVRCGIALYGIRPSEDESPDFGLKPALSLKTKILQLKKIPVGTPVSYGKTWVSTRESLCATIAAGYGDGFPRILSNRARALVRGVSAPVCGRICMDLSMLDVSDVPGVSVGDVVTLIGKDGSGEVSAWSLAELARTIPYEILTGIVSRVPRIFYP